MTAMAARPTFANEDWLVIITSDHGGLGTGHSGGLPPQRTIPFIVAGRLATTVSAAGQSAAGRRRGDRAHLFRRADSQQLRRPRRRPDASGPGARHAWARTSSSTATPNTTAASTATATQQYAAGWDDPGPGRHHADQLSGRQRFSLAGRSGPGESRQQLLLRRNQCRQHDDAAHRRQQPGQHDRRGQRRLHPLRLARRLLASNGRLANVDRPFPQRRKQRNRHRRSWRPSPRPIAATSPSLLFRDQVGDLPALTRFDQLELTATRAPTGENDGYADNISLVLALPATWT